MSTSQYTYIAVTTETLTDTCGMAYRVSREYPGRVQVVGTRVPESVPGPRFALVIRRLDPTLSWCDVLTTVQREIDAETYRQECRDSAALASSWRTPWVPDLSGIYSEEYHKARERRTESLETLAQDTLTWA